MKFSKKPIALAVFSLLAGAPLAAHAVSVSFKAPSSGATLRNVTWSNSSACEVSGSSIRRVQFYLIDSSGKSTSLNGDSSSPFRCTLDSTDFANGDYRLRATAYDSSGRSTTTYRNVTISNTSTTDAGPTISFSAPANNATVSALTTCRVNASDDRGVKQVQFFMDGTLLSTDTTSSYTCSIDNKKYTNGAHTLKAVVTDSANQSAETQITVNIAGGIGTSTGGTLPTITLVAPAAGVPLKGNVQGPPNCTVTGTNIAKIEFFLNGVLTNTDGNATNGWGCWIDTTKYKDGAYTLKAIAYNAAGQTTTASYPITIQNGATGGTNAAPTVGISAPATSAVLAGTAVPYTLTAGDSDGSVAKVELSVIGGGTTKVVASKTAAPWSGAFSTAGLPNGAAQLMAVATDNLGKQATTQRAVTINNTVVSDPGGGGGGGTSPVAENDIIGKARADVAFAQQSGYSAQVIGQHTSASSIPEPGINGTMLPNGERLRLGKVADPANPALNVFGFQLASTDPDTSGSKRSELSFSSNIEMNKVYWVAVSTYIPDWGSLSSSEGSLFGTQLHSGDSSLGLSPSFGLYTTDGGRNFEVQARWSTSSSPTPSNSVKAKYANRPIEFGRWVDFVFKFKHNTSGNGFLQVWMDGEQIVNHTGNLGFNTPGFKDYAKFGYYNWSSFSGTRKVMLRSPTVVADPTGNTYSAEQVRTLLGGSATSVAGGSTSSTGSGTTTADSGVCSSAICVVTQ